MTRYSLMLIIAASAAHAENCADIEDPTERLACYDRLGECLARSSMDDISHCLAAHEASNDSDRVPADHDAPVAASSAAEFGKREEEAGPPEYIDAVIVEVISKETNIDYLRLDNGQIWRETSDTRFRFREGKSVRITEGVLGSYNMKVEGSRRKLKVKRIR